MGLTITEALAEIKLITKKIENKKPTIMLNLVRATHIPDPLVDSKAAIASEVQAITDLSQRLITLRSAIAKANVENLVEINGKSMSIYDWLTWKREVATIQGDLFRGIFQGVKNSMDAIARQPQVTKDDKGAAHLVQYVFNVAYDEYVKKAESHQDTLDKLDGQLSLKNATIVLPV